MVKTKLLQAIDLLQQVVIKECESNDFRLEICKEISKDKHDILEELRKTYVGQYVRAKYSYKDDIIAYMKVDSIELQTCDDSVYVIVNGPFICNMNDRIECNFGNQRFFDIVTFNELCQIVDEEKVITFLNDSVAKFKNTFVK